jgi:hypothetical protein
LIEKETSVGLNVRERETGNHHLESQQKTTLPGADGQLRIVLAMPPGKEEQAGDMKKTNIRGSFTLTLLLLYLVTRLIEV